MAILSSGSKFLKTDEVKNGDVITFLSEGVWQESTKYKYDDGNPRKQFVMEVQYAGESRSFTVNATNRNELVNAFGNDTSVWVGKSATIELVKVSVGGKIKNSILLHPVKEVEEE
jgi:hypothetical protein